MSFSQVIGISLQTVNLPYVDRDECQENLEKADKILTPAMVCAGFKVKHVFCFSFCMTNLICSFSSFLTSPIESLSSKTNFCILKMFSVFVPLLQLLFFSS